MGRRVTLTQKKPENTHIVNEELSQWNVIRIIYVSSSSSFSYNLWFNQIDIHFVVVVVFALQFIYYYSYKCDKWNHSPIKVRRTMNLCECVSEIHHSNDVMSSHFKQQISSRFFILIKFSSFLVRGGSKSGIKRDFFLFRHSKEFWHMKFSLSRSR